VGLDGLPIGDELNLAAPAAINISATRARRRT